MLLVNLLCTIFKIESVCNYYYENEIFSNKIVQDDISLQFYYGPTVYYYTSINIRNGLDLLNQSSFNNTRKTVFYLHGYSEQPSKHIPGDSIDPFVEAMLVNHTVNLIVVNYEKLVPHDLVTIDGWAPDILNLNRDGGYLLTVSHAPQIGKYLYKFARDFVRACQCEERTHLIGFSLGAHMAGYMGQGAKSLGRSFSRITGLEPAQPFFEYVPFKPHLSKDDATFVDIVHSDAGPFQYGWNAPLGHVDFWANGGHPPQPACKLTRIRNITLCSHYMSTKYYFESINNPENFLAKKCLNTITWRLHLCNNTETTYFGYNLNTSVTGSFFFSTNVKSPYGKQNNGTRP